MNIKAILTSEEKKLKRKTPKAHEKHQFYYLREFIMFCLKEGVNDTTAIDEKIYSHYVRYLKHTKNNADKTRLDKCYTIKKFLEHYGCPFVPNPWRAYKKHARGN